MMRCWSARRPRAVARALAALTVSAALGACGSSSPHHSASPTTAATTVTSTTVTVPRHVLVATFADNGGSLNVLTNDRIRVVLAGMSWVQQSSDTAVLVATSQPTVLPASSGCVKGQGCGSVTVYYRAVRAGDAEILGARGNCDGAAAGCQAGPGAFKLKVVVAAS
jgi:hypothetical protein